MPQPAILELLAQPSMAIVNKGMNWDLMRAQDRSRGAAFARSRPARRGSEAAEAAANDPAASIELVGTSPAGALARFKNGYADGVIGGRFSTLPYFVASNIGRSRLVVDPVPGLFGLAFVRAEGFLAIDANRDALVRAIRRERLVDAFGLTEWQPQVTLRPALYARDGGPAPLLPAWAEYDEASRLAQAKRAVDAWRGAGREIEPLRIAVPDTPGEAAFSSPMYAADFKAIGVPSRRVADGVDRRPPPDRRGGAQRRRDLGAAPPVVPPRHAVQPRGAGTDRPGDEQHRRRAAPGPGERGRGRACALRPLHPARDAAPLVGRVAAL